MYLIRNEEQLVKIEFVDYTGEYPTYCSGVLTLRIDDKEVTFGIDDGCDYEKFWISGGGTYREDDGSMTACQHPWELEDDGLPEHLKPHAQELINIFNTNVPYGCCGGCI